MTAGNPMAAALAAESGFSVDPWAYKTSIESAMPYSTDASTDSTPLENMLHDVEFPTLGCWQKLCDRVQATREELLLFVRGGFHTCSPAHQRVREAVKTLTGQELPPVSSCSCQAYLGVGAAVRPCGEEEALNILVKQRVFRRYICLGFTPAAAPERIRKKLGPREQRLLMGGEEDMGSVMALDFSDPNAEVGIGGYACVTWFVEERHVEIDHRYCLGRQAFSLSSVLPHLIIGCLARIENDLSKDPSLPVPLHVWSGHRTRKGVVSENEVEVGFVTLPIYAERHGLTVQGARRMFYGHLMPPDLFYGEFNVFLVSWEDRPRSAERLPS
ncbi:hypothetical protein BC829DRAFT_405367 [Chytridium lagenaria]|nr:hypothetical protein BC829DRAFT_405367 [Chytridium lagenaria]